MPASSTSPIDQRIQRVLLERNGEPITLTELQTRLRREGQFVSTERLRVHLADRAVYTELAGQRYVLRERFSSTNDDTAEATSSPQLFLSNLPATLHTYVVLALETSGLDPAADQIIQLAALRVTDGKPFAFAEWYIQCDPVRISQAARQTQRLDAARLDFIARQPPLAALAPAISAFVGDDPLVIHNARFDTGFLRHHLPDLRNPVVDSLELALLIAPTAPRHTLSILADHLGILIEAIPTAGVIGLPVGYRVCAETLHNAATDVLVLQAVYDKLLRLWEGLPPAARTLYTALLPEAFGAPPTGMSPQLTPLVAAPTPLPPLPTPPLDPDALALLDRSLAHLGHTPRLAQQTMVRLVAEAFAQDHSLLIEAPTGTGKTLGYLVPAVWAARHSGRRVAIATALKNLQDQIRNEAGQLQDVIPFHVQTLKGAASYLCLRDLQTALDGAAEDPLERRFVLALLARLATDEEPPSLDALPPVLEFHFPSTRQVRAEVAVDRATCTERRCPFYSGCHLFAAYRRAQQADILLINQALWLADPNAMPPFDTLVLDEAHNLEDVATSTLTQEVSETSLRDALRRLDVPGMRRGIFPRILATQPSDEVRELIGKLRLMIGQSLRLVHELRATLASFLTGCDERLEPERGAQLRLVGPPERVYPTRWMNVQQALNQLWGTYLTPLIDGLQSLAVALPRHEETLWRTVQAVRQTLADQRLLLDTILRARRADLVTWIAVTTAGDQPGWGFYAAPISVAPLLAQRYSSLRSVVLTSATLTTGPRDFGFMVERLGLRGLLHDDAMHSLDGALPYGENVLQPHSPNSRTTARALPPARAA